MSYIPNPKTAGSGIICCIPQEGLCPRGCADCFFQSGRSYLEPLDQNLPNMPSEEEAMGKIVRVNDGNDSHVDQKKVIELTAKYPMRFYNTSFVQNIDEYDMPVVLTLNPGEMTDTDIHIIPHDKIPKNLMFVRVRTNTWNLDLVNQAVQHYTEVEVPIILTFMAYFKGDIPEHAKTDYIHRKRTSNEYWAITTDAWRRVMSIYEDNRWVYSCGKIEGERGITKCRHCGTCLREYFATIEKLGG